LLTPFAMAGSTIWRRSTMAIAKPVVLAHCARAARTPFVRSPASKTKPFSTAWPSAPQSEPEILDRRREVVEHPFGGIKQWMHQGAFLTCGLANVRADFSLTALAYNLRRAVNILGVEAMTAAVAARGQTMRLNSRGFGPRTPLRSHQAADDAEIARIPTPLVPRAPSGPTSARFHTVCKKSGRP
jgi:hypothetical protein